MRARGLLTGLAMALPVFCLAAGDPCEFELAALDAAIPASSRRSAAFSPMSFSVSAAAFGESVGTIERAAVAETIGTLSDFANTYAQAVTNIFAARALVLPDFRFASARFRRTLLDGFGVQVCARRPNGSAAYLKAAMDGEMESVELPSDKVSEGCDFFDLVSVGIVPASRFSESGGLEFHCADGTAVKFPAVEGRASCDLRDGGVYTVVRMPLVNECSLVLILPNAGVELAELREALTVRKLRETLATLGGLTDLRVVHGSMRLVLPKFDFTVRNDLLPLMGRFRLPTKGFEKFEGRRGLVRAEQHVRVRLGGNAAAPEDEDAVAVAAVSKAIVFDHPFIFLVQHGPTGMFKVAGQFTGRN